MHLLTITTSFPTSDSAYGGIFIFRTLNAMVGVEHTVLVPGDNQETWNNLLKDGELVRVKYAPRILSVLTSSKIEGGLPMVIKKHPWSLLLYPMMLLSLFYNSLSRCNRETIIHAHWLPNGLVGILLKKVKNIPLVITIRGTDQSLLNLPVLGKICVWILKNCDVITTVSEDLKNKVSEISGLNTKTIFIPNGVNMPKKYVQPPISNKYKFLYVGSLIPRKGVDILIKAFIKLNLFEKTKLVIGGAGMEKNRLNEIVEKNKVGKYIELLGEIEPNNVQNLMLESDCFVLPSYFEGTPNVIKESMACGVPVIATNVSGNPELVISGETGLLFEPGDVNTLTEHLRFAFENQKIMKAMGEKCIEFILSKQLTWKNTARMYESVYSNIYK